MQRKLRKQVGSRQSYCNDDHVFCYTLYVYEMIQTIKHEYSVNQTDKHGKLLFKLYQAPTTICKSQTMTGQPSTFC